MPYVSCFTNDTITDGIITGLFSVLNLSGVSKKLIEMKAEELSSRIKWVALASAVGGAIPIPGLSAVVDIALVTKELKFQKEQLHQ